MRLSVEEVYRRLFERYGVQQWWPADSPFEVMVGAVLTQNTNWSNVERAIANLKAVDWLSPEAIASAAPAALASVIRPSGYFNIKAKRLQNLCRWYLDRGEGALRKLDTLELRKSLLSVNGVGFETADDILLYAFERPLFVIDAYTRRLFSRLGHCEPDVGYEALRHYLQQELVSVSEPVGLFNEYHALIVAHAKVHCLKRPRCGGCPLLPGCYGAQDAH